MLTCQHVPASAHPATECLFPRAAVYPALALRLAAASCCRGVTPCKFMSWLNALLFYSNNHVLEGAPSLESGEQPAALSKFAFSWFLQQGCPITCPASSSARAVPGWSKPAPGFLCKLPVCFKHSVNQGVTSDSGKH